MRNLKTRLEKSKSKRVEDLLSILLVYHTMSKIPTGEMPSSMMYGTELVILGKIRMPSFRISNFDKKNNEIELILNLDLLDEKTERTKICQASYKHQVAKYYNQRIKHKSFLLGNLVLRKVILAIKEPNAGKFGPTWEDPYKVVKVSKPRIY